MRERRDEDREVLRQITELSTSEFPTEWTPEFFQEAEHRAIFFVLQYMYTMGITFHPRVIYEIARDNYIDFCSMFFSEAEFEQGYHCVLDELYSIFALDDDSEMISSLSSDLVMLQSVLDQSNVTTNQYNDDQEDGANEYEPSTPLYTLGQAMEDSVAEMEAEAKGEIVRLKTGFERFDRVIGGGLEDGNLYVLGGDPKVGKSLIVTQIALHLATNGIPIALMSFEMGRRAIGKRCLQMLSGVESVDKASLQRLKQVEGEFSALPFYIIDSHLDVDGLEAQSRRLRKLVRVLIIDYLHLVSGRYGSKSKTDEVNEVLRMLMGLKTELSFPILLVAPLAIKGMQFRRSKRPTCADFKDTGQLPYDADYSLFLWKPQAEDESIRELVVAQSRHCRSDVAIPLRFDEKRLTFREMGDKPTLVKLRRKEELSELQQLKQKLFGGLHGGKQ